MKFRTSNIRISSLKNLFFFSLFAVFLMMQSCYSFTGSSLSPETQTILIRSFPNNAANNNPNLSQDFTVAIQNRFLQRTTLKGAVEKPDILIEGEIIDYNITPTTISSPIESSSTGNMIQAAQNKLTMTVKVHYENHVVGEEKKSFDRTYTDEVTFNSDMDLMTIESSQVKIVTDRIITKIFNDIVADW
ncbi:LPS assembly lipoprotein LptE [Soonwooa purpurea]